MYKIDVSLPGIFCCYYADLQEDGLPTASTKFLALDKCLPQKRFLQILDLPHDEDKEIALEYDLEWLTVLSLTNHLLSTKEVNNYMPGPGSNKRYIKCIHDFVKSFSVVTYYWNNYLLLFSNGNSQMEIFSYPRRNRLCFNQIFWEPEGSLKF